MIKNGAVSNSSVIDDGRSGKDKVINRWLKLIVVLLIVQMFGVFVLSMPNSVPIYINHLAVNPIASSVTGSQVDSYASSKIFQVSLVGLIETMVLIAVLIYCLQLTVYKRTYMQDLKTGVSRFKWIEYGLSTGLAMVILGLVYGVYDIVSLLMIFLFIIVSAVVGYFLQGQKNLKGSSGSVMLWTGIICTLIPPVVNVFYLIFGQIYGNIKVSTYIYWSGAVFLVYLAIFWNKVYTQFTIGRKFDVLDSEKVYLISNLAFKTIFIWLLFSGLLHS